MGIVTVKDLLKSNAEKMLTKEELKKYRLKEKETKETALKKKLNRR